MAKAKVELIGEYISDYFDDSSFLVSSSSYGAVNAPLESRLRALPALPAMILSIFGFVIGVIGIFGGNSLEGVAAHVIAYGSLVALCLTVWALASFIRARSAAKARREAFAKTVVGLNGLSQEDIRDRFIEIDTGSDLASLLVFTGVNEFEIFKRRPRRFRNYFSREDSGFQVKRYRVSFE